MTRMQCRIMVLWGLLAFSAGTIFGLFAGGETVQAAQERPPKNLSETQKRFIDGGSRDYAALKEIQRELQENGRRTARLEASLSDISRNVQAIPAKLDSTNRLLAQIRDAHRDSRE